jgi:hypothetical protein
MEQENEKKEADNLEPSDDNNGTSIISYSKIPS